MKPINNNLYNSNFPNILYFGLLTSWASIFVELVKTRISKMHYFLADDSVKDLTLQRTFDFEDAQQQNLQTSVINEY